MTAIQKYSRLESTAKWIETQFIEPKDVIISFGKKTLVITNFQDKPLAHWSLTSTNIISKNRNEAIFSPDPEGIEKLIVEDKNMIEAIELFISKKNIKKKKINLLFFFIPVILILIILITYNKNYKYYFLPLISDAQETQILNDDIIKHIKSYGPVCQSPSGEKAISKLKKSLGNSFDDIEILVLSNQSVNSIHLPSSTLILSKSFLNETKNSLDFVSLMHQVNYERNNRIPLKKIIEKNSMLNIFRFVIGLTNSLKINSLNELEMRPRKTDIKEIKVLSDHSWVAIKNICFN